MRMVKVMGEIINSLYKKSLQGVLRSAFGVTVVLNFLLWFNSLICCKLFGYWVTLRHYLLAKNIILDDSVNFLKHHSLCQMLHILS